MNRVNKLQHDSKSSALEHSLKKGGGTKRLAGDMVVTYDDNDVSAGCHDPPHLLYRLVHLVQIYRSDMCPQRVFAADSPKATGRLREGDSDRAGIRGLRKMLPPDRSRMQPWQIRCAAQPEPSKAKAGRPNVFLGTSVRRRGNYETYAVLRKPS
jgi:hypothetical protein